MQNDVVIVGGSFAGLAAATYLARARRSVCVLDTRAPRNRFADASHGFLAQDGSDPLAILATARREVASYPTVRMIEGEARSAERTAEGFSVALAGGETFSARKAILAYGLRDELPAVPGLAERWGKSVLHCPYCHGYEFSDRPLGVLYRTEMSIHQAQMVAEWGPTTIYLDGAEIDGASVRALTERGIAVEPARVCKLEGPGSALEAIALEGGRSRPLAALYIAPRSCLASPLATLLGAQVDEGPMGPMVRTDSDKMTSVPGLYAAGDIARAPHSVSWAVADGVTAGTAAHRALVFA